MLIKNIIFIEPKAEKIHIYSRYNLPRIGSLLLATIMRDRGFQTKVLFLKEKEILKKQLNPDLIAISTITPTAPQAYRIASHFRNKGIPVVMGGPHVTFLPEEALNHADYCIRGEGETALPKLVEALNSGDNLNKVPGLSYHEGDKINSNPLAEPICNLDSLPFPDYSLLEYSGNKLASIFSQKQIIPIQTSRGCPFDCTFCSVTEMFGKKYRFRSAKSVINELKRFDPRKHRIFFYDDNFTANIKRSKKLLRMMINLNLDFKWSAQVRVDVARDQELLDLMYEAGCRFLYIGFESIDPKSLKEMKKAQSLKQIKWAIKEITRRNIYIHGMFVFGFDSDTLKTVKNTVNFAIREKIDSAQFCILTPFPGTQFYHKIIRQGKLFDTKWHTFDAHHVKFKPHHFTELELQKAQIRAHSRFYSLFNLLRRLIRGKMVSFLIGLYANNLNKKWQKIERYYLQYLNRILLSKIKQVPQSG